MKLDWHEFMSTSQERHAFAIGFFEVLCPWPPRHNFGDNCLPCLKEECHYYLFGRGMGVIAWIIIAKIIQVVFW